MDAMEMSVVQGRRLVAFGGQVKKDVRSAPKCFWRQVYIKLDCNSLSFTRGAYRKAEGTRDERLMMD
jgi:hypothetical protein